VLERTVIALSLKGGELVVDLSAVGFIDSTGLRAILVCEALLERVNCRFVLRSPSTAVRKVLELTGLLAHLTVLPAADPAAD
jgi:anti-sigma B factor antagonist